MTSQAVLAAQPKTNFDAPAKSEPTAREARAEAQSKNMRVEASAKNTRAEAVPKNHHVTQRIEYQQNQFDRFSIGLLAPCGAPQLAQDRSCNAPAVGLSSLASILPPRNKNLSDAQRAAAGLTGHTAAIAAGSPSCWSCRGVASGPANPTGTSKAFRARKKNSAARIQRFESIASTE